VITLSRRVSEMKLPLSLVALKGREDSWRCKRAHLFGFSSDRSGDHNQRLVTPGEYTSLRIEGAI
jgi:hypothetical protein